MLLKILFQIIIVISVTISSVMSKEITVINAGSKSGVTFIESQEIVEILNKKYPINFINPGNACIAQNLVKSTKTPVIFIWDGTYEASARSNNNHDCMINFVGDEIFKRNNVEWRICSLKDLNKSAKDLISIKSQYRIGTANPSSLFLETVNAINTTFNTSHTAIHYSGGFGSMVTALQNKEIDFALFSTKFANKIQYQGIVCLWTLGSDNILSLPSLAKTTGNNSTGLIRMYQMILVGKNFDKETFNKVKQLIRTAEESSGTALNIMYQGLSESEWDLSVDQLKIEWEKSIDLNLVKK